MRKALTPILTPSSLCLHADANGNIATAPTTQTVTVLAPQPYVLLSFPSVHGDNS